MRIKSYPDTKSTYRAVNRLAGRDYKRINDLIVDRVADYLNEADEPNCLERFVELVNGCWEYHCWMN